ncbi:bifunctional phosphopantothenoylcysteine decarboxylase/phosphopantothenate--cysteine ligase CoaBC [Arenicella xantha]|uniref:Coenzyme A biosynthesis bifunctional protein CoaBC n=1 Tax=Arenicella xantha TaxID=644221 RepID=A0A395JH89_9GAMM|nr:bifunctional phosphopantothenoylcysteine decarboxylase/phosphopantothenate--cysteine ligase CoaBC [Arenicella xantha]RBP49330.1 phosphopantothenoylcysteine decarboxylase/phosphopantothenate--cysteine ligase [Arenicella xantha]
MIRVAPNIGDNRVIPTESLNLKTLTNKRVLLGVSAGIAAYKTPDLVRKLTELGAEVQVIMSRNSEQFVAPLALQAVSGHAVHNYAMTAESESGMGHIDLARWADIVLIAPATANIIARLCQGNADELLTTVCVATEAPIAVAPAMNQQMWQNHATLSNIDLLTQRQIHVLGPDSGEQACGEVGPGRMLQPAEIAQRVAELFTSTALTGRRIMLTAGPTWEAIDPVRGITNHSSGMMGYALAQAAAEAGAQVTLISGPTSLTKPERVTSVDVVSACDMHNAVMERIAEQDIFIGVAAVADYRPVDSADQKIKKNADEMTITMVKNPDILADVANLEHAPFCVGFAAETHDVVDYARGKLERKKLDLIAANHVGGSETGFGVPDNAISLISRDRVLDLPKQSKHALARRLIIEIADSYQKKNEKQT